MKQLVVACFLGLYAASVAASNVNVQWVEDSYSGFDVILTGIGFDPSPNGGNVWASTVTSPSGLWQLYSWNSATYNSYTASLGYPVGVDNQATVTFLGQLPLSIDPTPSPGDNVMHTRVYDDLFPAVTPIQDGISWGEYPADFLETEGWNGYNPIVVNSMPVLTDPTTWTWSAEYTATGPSLAPGVMFVPEPGSLTIIGCGCLALLWLRRTSRFWGSESRLIPKRARVPIVSRRKR